MADGSSPTGPRSSPGAVIVVAADEQAELDVDVERWARLAESALRDLGVTGELTLTFVDTEEMTALNHDHMGVDGPTDVLSFPLDAPDLVAIARGTSPVSLEEHTSPYEDVPLLLGDVVICPSVAATAAPDHAGTLDDELALLVVHGVLHLLGHDHAHEEDATVMRAAELDLLERLHWSGPAPAGFRQEQP
jgi:probable rRNA maturation factor